MNSAKTFIVTLTSFLLSIPLTAEEQTEDSTQSLITNLLSQNLGTRSFPFSEVITASTGKKVIPYAPANLAHQQISDAIASAAEECMAELNATDSPIRKLRRINEASRYFEDLLLIKINLHPELACSIPLNAKGTKQRSGYPDLLITHTGSDGELTHFYLDPKLYEEKSRASSLRTFYYEPRTTTNKIQHDATHLLIGFSHDGNDGLWTFTSWEIADLSTISIRLKAEFQTSNRELYRDKSIIKSSQQGVE